MSLTSLFRKKDDESDELQRNDLVASLALVMKQLQLTFAVEQTRISTGDKHLMQFCMQLERVFLFGLRERGLFDKSQANAWWDLLCQITRKDGIDTLNKLYNVHTKIGKCRAWMRLALNEACLESYLSVLGREAKLVRDYYEPYAVFRDEEKVGILVTLSAGLGSISFNVNVDDLSLDQESFPHAQEPLEAHKMRAVAMPCYADHDSGHGHHPGGVAVCEACQQTRSTPPASPLPKYPLSQSLSFGASTPTVPAAPSSSATGLRKSSKTSTTPVRHIASSDMPYDALADTGRTARALSSNSNVSVESGSSESERSSRADSSASAKSIGSYTAPPVPASSFVDASAMAASNSALQPKRPASSTPMLPTSGPAPQAAAKPTPVPFGSTTPVAPDKSMYLALIEEMVREDALAQEAKLQQLKASAPHSATSPSSGTTTTTTSSGSGQGAQEEPPSKTNQRSHSSSISVLNEGDYGGILAKHVAAAEPRPELKTSVPLSGQQKAAGPAPTSSVLSSKRADSAPALSASASRSTSLQRLDEDSAFAEQKSKPMSTRQQPFSSTSSGATVIFKSGHEVTEFGEVNSLVEALEDTFPFASNFEQEKQGSRDPLSTSSSFVAVQAPGSSQQSSAAASHSSSLSLSGSAAAGKDEAELQTVLAEIAGLEGRIRLEFAAPSMQKDRERDRRAIVEQLVNLRLQELEIKDRLALASSGGQSGGADSNVDTIKGHGFKLTNYSVPTFCDQCSSFIWGVYRQGYRCTECGYNVHKKCMAAITSMCPSTLGGNASYLLAICPELGLDQQDYKCHECRRPIGFKGLFAEARLCDYVGKYFCDDCHWSTPSVIPARIIHNWDFKQYKVCKSSKQLLTLLEKKPLILVERANPKLGGYVEELREAKKIREQLCSMKGYIFTCRNAAKLANKKSLKDRMHLIESPSLYSLQDLLDLNAGTLLPLLEKIRSQYLKHITSVCELCQAKGFICESCEDKTVIYPFQQDTAACPKCFTVLHRTCYSPDHCPKCERIEKRRLEKEAHTHAP